jgi:hypothetical protein
MGWRLCGGVVVARRSCFVVTTGGGPQQGGLFGEAFALTLRAPKVGGKYEREKASDRCVTGYVLSTDSDLFSRFCTGTIIFLAF